MNPTKRTLTPFINELNCYAADLEECAARMDAAMQKECLRTQNRSVRKGVSRGRTFKSNAERMGEVSAILKNIIAQIDCGLDTLEEICGSLPEMSLIEEAGMHVAEHSIRSSVLERVFGGDALRPGMRGACQSGIRGE